MSEAKITHRGVVYRLLGKVASVRASRTLDDTGAENIKCYLRGRLFDKASSSWKNQLAVGDEVDFERLDDDSGKGVITRIHERRSQLVRKLTERKGRLQLVAANVDQVVIVSAIRSPPYRLGLIDRYLAIAHYARIAPAICINKIDLATERDRLELDSDLSIYRKLEYPIIETSAKAGIGIDALRELLTAKRSVLVGHSGVGKSKLAQAMQPSAKLISSALDRRGRGRHTTSAAVLVPLDPSGELVDTPGVRELGIQHIPAEELADCYPSMRAFVDQCKFHPCTHVHEPECAIQRATRDGAISDNRYASYTKLYGEITESS